MSDDSPGRPGGDRPMSDDFRERPGGDRPVGDDSPERPGDDRPVGDDEDYRGPATIETGELSVTVTVRLSARFEPIEGRYRWAGRAAPDEVLTAQLRSGLREATVHIGGAATQARLGEPDPWGGVRLTGTGRPPWHAAAS